jgi:hypothetical protein
VQLGTFYLWSGKIPAGLASAGLQQLILRVHVSKKFLIVNGASRRDLYGLLGMTPSVVLPVYIVMVMDLKILIVLHSSTGFTKMRSP